MTNEKRLAALAELQAEGESMTNDSEFDIEYSELEKLSMTYSANTHLLAILTSRIHVMRLKKGNLYRLITKLAFPKQLIW